MQSVLVGGGIKWEFGILIAFEILNPRLESPPASVMKSSRTLVCRTSMLQMLSMMLHTYWGTRGRSWLAVLIVLRCLRLTLLLSWLGSKGGGHEGIVLTSSSLMC